MREDDGGGAVDGRAVKRRSAGRGEEAGEKSRSGISMFLMVSLRKTIDRGCQVEFFFCSCYLSSFISGLKNLSALLALDEPIDPLATFG